LEIKCQLGFALLAMAGASVEIEMRLDGAAGSWFLLQGRVARIRAASHTLVIAIDALLPPLAALIASQDDKPAVSPIEVMVVDGDRVRRARVAEAFRAEGCHVAESSTPLEALDGLDTAPYATDVIAVADTALYGAAVDLRNYLDGTYLDTLVIAVGNPKRKPSRVLLDPSDVLGQLGAHVRSVLRLRPPHHAAFRNVGPTAY
jgi:CheY-like chemotaxis protein